MARRALSAALRQQLGSLVVLPAVVLLWGSTWQLGGGLDQRWLLPVLFGGWLGLRRLAAGAGPLAGVAGRGLALWRRFDPLLAALALHAVLFRPPQTLWLPLGLVAALALLLSLLRRASGSLLLSLAVAVLVFGVAVPRIFRAALIARIARSHALDVDHRLLPDGNEINSDGARFRGEAEDLSDEDFVILFLGDSFTFGFNLPYEKSYPQQLERLAERAGCTPKVRAVTLAWTSASPLLGLRILREVGRDYRPDLVVYGLDMTDFHDDLRYERALREQRDYDFDATALLERSVALRAPWAQPLLAPLRSVTDRLRRAEPPGRAGLIAGLEVPGPRERFFATARPLERTRAAIELGVMRNLAEIHAHSREVLGAEMALALLPRAYQYSDRESPRNWEGGEYERLGPFVREPFRYFEEVAAALPYPVLSLLPDFERSDAFPLYFANDPHWNQRGAALAARSLFAGLRARGLLPCEGG